MVAAAMGQPITVTENPGGRHGVVRFDLNRSLTGMGHERYRAGQEIIGDRPPDELARRLFAHGGVEGVHIYSNVVTVDLATPPAAGEVRLPSASVAGLGPPPGPTSGARWIYYSSGTTAAPKGIRHNDASLLAPAAGLADKMGITSSDVDPIASIVVADSAPSGPDSARRIVDAMLQDLGTDVTMHAWPGPV